MFMLHTIMVHWLCGELDQPFFCHPKVSYQSSQSLDHAFVQRTSGDRPASFCCPGGNATEQLILLIPILARFFPSLDCIAVWHLHSAVPPEERPMGMEVDKPEEENAFKFDDEDPRPEDRIAGEEESEQAG